MEIICFLLSAFTILIIIRIVLSWFPVSHGGALAVVTDLVYRATEWCLGPLRRVLPPVRMGAMALDLSPIIVLIAAQVLEAAICRR